MKLKELKNIIVVTRVHIFINGKEEKKVYRGYEVPQFFEKYGEFEVDRVQAFKSEDNAMDFYLKA